MLDISFEKQLGIIFDGKRFDFVVIGAGGTGGHFLPNLARQVSIKNEEIKSNDIYQGLPSGEYCHTITLIDADDVEPKNLIRQNFASMDVGKNKAEVLAKRYGRTFGVNIGAMSDYVSSPKDLLMKLNTIRKTNTNRALLDDDFDEVDEDTTKNYRDYIKRTHLDRNRVFVIIDCTDNNKTRLIINEVGNILKTHRVVLLSSGNEEHSGQVSFGIKSNAVGIGYQLADIASNPIIHNDTTRMFSIPCYYDIFPDSPVDKLPEELSCAESAVSAPQNISANINAANILFDFVNKMLNNVPIREYLVFFDSESMARSVFKLTETDVKRGLSLVKNNYFLNNEFPVLDKPVSPNLVSPPTWDEVRKKDKEESERKRAEAQAMLNKKTNEDVNVEIKVEQQSFFDNFTF